MWRIVAMLSIALGCVELVQLPAVYEPMTAAGNQCRNECVISAAALPAASLLAPCFERCLRFHGGRYKPPCWFRYTVFDSDSETVKAEKVCPPPLSGTPAPALGAPAGLIPTETR